MKINHAMIVDAIDEFVTLFNQGRFDEACRLYDEDVWLCHKEQLLTCRSSIVGFFTESNYANIINHGVDTVNTSPDGKLAIALIRFTAVRKIQTNDGECYTFSHSICDLMFELNNNLLCATSGSIIAHTRY